MKCSIATCPIQFHLWLIGRGGPADSHLSDSSPPTSLNRGYLGQVHIFEPTKFTQPVYSFDLDNGFLPTTAVYVKYAKGERQFMYHKYIYIYIYIYPFIFVDGFFCCQY
ncbi:unnamed protein product [Trichobilharzia regenti]|nr:unnamed protein product [Trichobilharzia regenti]